MSEIEITGKNLEEALELAAKELKTTKDNIKYEILEESNKRLFSILAPKYTKIKAEIIDGTKKVQEKEYNKNNETVILTDNERAIISEKINKFLSEYLKSMQLNYTYEIKFVEEYIDVIINGDNSGLLIGYRGEILDALQLLINTIVNKIPTIISKGDMITVPSSGFLPWGTCTFGHIYPNVFIFSGCLYTCTLHLRPLSLSQ